MVDDERPGVEGATGPNPSLTIQGPTGGDYRNLAATGAAGPIAPSSKPVPPEHAGFISVPATFAAGDQLEALMRVLKNLPTAKPSDTSLHVQLTGPALVGVKALYDATAAIVEMSNNGFSLKHVILLCIALVFLCAAAWGADVLRRNHAAAKEAKADPNYDWAVSYVQRLIDAQGEAEKQAAARGK